MNDTESFNHVAVLPRWKEYLCHAGSSFTVNSIRQAGGQDTEEGRQTVFFTPLDPSGNEATEEYDDFSTPRKLHYQNKWKVSQITILGDTVL